MEVNRNRNGQNRQTQDHTDGKTYENTTSDNETCALWIQKVFTFNKKSKMVQKCLLVIFVL